MTYPEWNQQPPTPPPPPGPPGGHRPASQSPWWRATWALIAAGLIVGIVIGAGAGASAKKTKDVAVPGPTVSTTQSVTATVTLPGPTVTTTPIDVVATHTRTATVTYTPPPPKQYGEGTYVVGTDIKAGTYHTSGASDCYWARLSSLDTSDIIDNSVSSGPQTVQIHSSDKAFEIQGSCTFGRI